MNGFDVNRFLAERRPDWDALEVLLAQVDRGGLGTLGIDGAKRFGKLYRGVSSDLIRARTELVDASVVDYLNDLVARAYAHIHATKARRARGIVRFYLEGFPRLVREEWKAIGLSAALLVGGAAVGAIAVAVDSDALGVFIPEGHSEVTPDERVAQDRGGSDAPAAFSTFLFTHNIQVTFLVFAMGITFGVGSSALLLANGFPLGALAMQYHQAGHGVFFWAWILPHGVPELTSIFIGGGAGLLIARALWIPGRRRRRDALIHEGRRAVFLVLGTMPILVVAGLIEGTISQMHEPMVPSWLKLAFAGLVGLGLYGWLLLGGRRKASEDLSASPQVS